MITGINMADVVNSTEFTQPLTVIRHTGGKWIDGDYIEIENTISIKGVVSAASDKDIDLTAEGGRVSEYKTVHTTTRLYTTDNEGTSDVIIWNGEKYKVMSVMDAGDYGYYRATMHRLNVTE